MRRLRLSASRLLADLLERDPDRMAKAVELGLVERAWLERPGEASISTATPAEVLERWLEGEVERRPSTLRELGLSAIQILSSATDEAATDGVPDTLTVAFTDLEGFSAFNAEQGDKAASRLLSAHHRRVGPIVRGRGGRVVKRIGDGLLLTFLEPEAAVLAGLELVESAQPGPLRLRVGLHLGEVLVMRDRDVLGHVVNVAARVTRLARGGEVLVTAAVRDSVEGLPSVTFERLRRRRVKGVGEQVAVCPVRRT